VLKLLVLLLFSTLCPPSWGLTSPGDLDNGLECRSGTEVATIRSLWEWLAEVLDWFVDASLGTAVVLGETGLVFHKKYIIKLM